MPIVTETTQEFTERNGGTCVRVGNKMIFPSGAQSDPNDMLRWEPPRDAHARLLIQKRYWEERARRATEDFNNLKRTLVGSGHIWQWPRHEYDKPDRALSGPEALKFLQGQVRQRQRELDRIQSELDATPEGQAALQRQEAQRQMAAEQSQRAAAFEAEVMAVEIY